MGNKMDNNRNRLYKKYKKYKYKEDKEDKDNLNIKHLMDKIYNKFKLIQEILIQIQIQIINHLI